MLMSNWISKEEIETSLDEKNILEKDVKQDTATGDKQFERDLNDT